RRVHQCGKLADGGLLRHSVSVSFGGGLGPARDGTILLRGKEPARRGAIRGCLLPDRPFRPLLPPSVAKPCIPRDAARTSCPGACERAGGAGARRCVRSAFLLQSRDL